jgi:porphobilinogen deaminase
MRDLLFGLSPARAYLRFMIERDIFCRYRLNCRDAVGVYADINEETLKTDIMILAEPMSESDNDNLPNCETVE